MCMVLLPQSSRALQSPHYADEEVHLHRVWCMSPTTTFAGWGTEGMVLRVIQVQSLPCPTICLEMGKKWLRRACFPSHAATHRMRLSLYKKLREYLMLVYALVQLCRGANDELVAKERMKGTEKLLCDLNFIRGREVERKRYWWKFLLTVFLIKFVRFLYLLTFWFLCVWNRKHPSWKHSKLWAAHLYSIEITNTL